MIALLEPIQVEAIGLANVRYFAPPTGGHGFPWPSIEDLFAVVVMDRRMRRIYELLAYLRDTFKAGGGAE